MLIELFFGDSFFVYLEQDILTSIKLIPSPEAESRIGEAIHSIFYSITSYLSYTIKKYLLLSGLQNMFLVP
jgi:hypothetical protein